MNILIMANIGNSDLEVDGQRPKRARPDGEAILQRLAEHQIEFPILEPCLRHIQRQHPNETARLICFYTDQPETPPTTQPDRHGVSLRDKDTIWFARIAAQVLPERFAGWLHEVQPMRIEGSSGPDLNPSIYDEAFEAYGDLLRRSYDQTVDLCYILTAGGIPACNFALQLQSIIAYAERCRFIYPPESGRRVNELRIGEQMQSAIQRANAIAALKQYNFPSALISARAAQSSDWVIGLLEYAVYREAFDFKRALQSIEQTERRASGSTRELCADLRANLQQLSEQNDQAALLREVAYSAEIALRNGRYADMLGRIFRLQEGVLRLVVERYLELPTDMSRSVKETNLARYLEQIDANQALREYLDQKTIDDKPLRYRDGPNRPVMQALIEFVINGGVRNNGQPWNKNVRERLKAVYHILQRFDRLSDLRNQSVIAHGFAGVSREEIDALYEGGAEKIVKDIGAMLKQLDVAEPESPFTKVVETVQSALQRGL